METMAMITAKSLSELRIANEKYGVFFNAFSVTQQKNVNSDSRTDIKKTFGYQAAGWQFSRMPTASLLTIRDI